MPNISKYVASTAAATLLNVSGVFSHSSSSSTSTPPLTTIQPSPSHSASAFTSSPFFYILLGAGLLAACICCVMCYRVRCMSPASEERQTFSRFTRV